ncbi:MAG: hypothetical protein ABJD13_00115 [Paracoccaceae bacterium]
MKLIEETTVPDGALPVDDLRAHLRLGTGFAEDTVQDEVLRSFLRASLAAIEGRTGKVLLERTFRMDVIGWQCPDTQSLPVAPVVAINSIEIVQRLGERSVVDGDVFWLEQDNAHPKLRAVGYTLPNIPSAGRAEISFAAGYGPDWSDLPVDLRQAVMLLAAHYYEFRNDMGLSEGCMPFGVTSLIERYKTMRLFAGGAR